MARMNISNAFNYYEQGEKIKAEENINATLGLLLLK